jgi:hypothetical protein
MSQGGVCPADGRILDELTKAEKIIRERKV